MTVLRLFARYAYVPTMLIGMNALAVLLIASGASYLWAGAVFAAALLLSLLMERVLPYVEAWNEDHGDAAKDAAHGVIYESANMAAILLLPVTAWLRPWHGDIWPTHLTLAVQLLIAIVVADLCMTLLHYVSHRVAPLWRLHAIHHGVHRLYGFNGLVRHPLHQLLDLAAGTLPLLIAGLPVEVAVLLALAISVQLLVQHSNIDYALGPFRNHLAIGTVHRLHHVNWRGEGDVNFGLFFTLWDRLLGTLRTESPRAPGVGDVGVEGEPAFPQHYLTQLKMPFAQDEEQIRAAPERTG